MAQWLSEATKRKARGYVWGQGVGLGGPGERQERPSSAHTVAVPGWSFTPGITGRTAAPTPGITAAPDGPGWGSQ